MHPTKRQKQNPTWVFSGSGDFATAKLILTDGTLIEYSYPVKVSYVLHKFPANFICDSDEMDFDGVVAALDAGDELQLGQLYFALPLEKMNRRLPAEDMAALVVKASSALVKTGGGRSEKCGSPPLAVVSGEEFRKVPRRSGGSRKFTAKLSAIPE